MIVRERRASFLLLPYLVEKTVLSDHARKFVNRQPVLRMETRVLAWAGYERRKSEVVFLEMILDHDHDGM